MGKTRAEIQKAYRERKKAENKEEYLRKERERRRKNYIPSDQLSRRDRQKRNAKNNEVLKCHRSRKREMVRAQEAADNMNQNAESMDTSGYESPGTHTDTSAKLVVRIPFRRNGPKKQISRALSKKSRECTKLKTDYVELQRKYKTTLRRLQRLKNKNKNVQPNTPRSKTEAQMREARLSNEQAKKIRKQLLISNVLIEEIKTAKKVNKPGKTKILRNVVAGRIVKKYKCIKALSTKTGLNRNKVGKVDTKSLDYRMQRRSREVVKFRDKVIEFFERGDNSRAQPGKADKVKTGIKESTQTRVLTDYLSNLHSKFISENPTVKLSLASFQRIRPKYIRTTAFITRDSCLCTKHQNMALLLKTLRQTDQSVPANPEKFVNNHSLDTIVDKLPKTDISFDEWRRVSVEEKDKKKMVMKIVKISKPYEEFVTHLKKQTQEFQAHVFRMKNQYEQIRVLKEKLPTHHVVIHMDFAENYACKSMEEIQSAYWNQQSVTLHPIVVYTKNAGDEMRHQSFLIVSDDMNHNASSVLTFVKTIIQDIKEIDPHVECLHFWTDSPTSQYRNRTIFNYIENHEETTGIKARWNYFEAGHGKGPCDGLGGATKRMADQAMKSGKVVIQDAKDFFAWTQSSICTMLNVKFRFVGKTGRELEAIPTKTIKGTMKVHAIVGKGNNQILVREVSCYCEICLEGGHCDSWTLESTSTETSNDQETESETPSTHDTEQAIDIHELFEVGDLVVVLYDNKWYVGKIIETDPEDQDRYIYHVQFMQRRKKMFQWGRDDRDKAWRKDNDIKFRIQRLIPACKSGRMFKLDDSDWDRIRP